jgi:hypothetical protein
MTQMQKKTVAEEALAATQAMTPHERLNALLENSGVSKTVYTYVMPETEAALDILLDQDRDALHDMYREAWTQKQDSMHEEFFATWKKWSAPIVKLDADDYPFVYTTGGASEALREAVYAYGHQARVEGFTPTIHVFDGDYEGFSAYAQAAGIQVVSHNRRTWRETLSKIGAQDQVYFSQPSAIDGNVWGECDDFIGGLYKLQPKAQVILDVTYVGCVARSFKVDTSAPNIRAVLFSLSKPMGVYYHRIGGMLSRVAYPGLFGNKWFKNLLSIRLGTLMMQRHGVHDLPSRYSLIGQTPALFEARAKLKLDLAPADIYMLATGKPSAEPTDLEQYLLRGGKGEEKVRLCLTPTIARLVNPAIDSTVRARAHEGIGKS